ncbi:uncharacterized protein N7446_013821 [Penicillium canescens]|uniref:Xylanolytic transcriptional activator regulatory domain-containing protein n=1 Tax=Penicillium canescens TaxID=5083 RepID=A0AAD6HZU3_PENCN|nr:uncharacterized protein N7446_013821 [Penicillium canescens]KAJ6023459.1 hypothetical protein N7460_013854 [Penicillium canescens]KAJ6025268.1 hypothetical protein N7444_012947 [Penicillium canescens]KAJ6042755.1 hypothetical protein N7446_013821 [Penicillium canescens]
MADDMDATLQKVLDTLGMTEQAVRPITPPNNATLKPPSMVKHEGSGDRNLDQQHATSLPVPEQGHCLPHSGISGMSSIPQHNNSSIVALESDQSVLTEDSPGSILNSWIFDLDFGTHITPSASDMQQQQQQQQPLLGSSPNDELAMPPTGQVEFIEPVYTESGSTLFKQPTSTSDIEGLVDEISDRVGTLKIGPGGKTRFYGPTSTFCLTEMPFLDNYEANQPKPIYHSESEEDIPTALEDHLLNLYFSWQDPSFHIVDRDIYEEAKEKWGNLEETPYYSEALRNAMCALGSAFESRYHPTFITFPKTLVEFFGDRAKSILETELDSPCVATIQAMVILSSHEIGNGNNARGWLYSGSALRLAFDLALHLDMSSYVSAGIISTRDAELRRTVFWTAYIVDQFVIAFPPTCTLSRPFRTSMEDVTIGKPRQCTGPRGQCRWTPYEPSSVSHDSGLLDSKDAISQQLVSLCELMAPCGYGTSSISKEILQELNAKIVAELRKWKATLPLNLQINLDDYTSPYLPHVLLLHMQYHQNIIYAHRPWISKSHLQPQPPRGPGYTHAREMCIQSAIAISKILNMYDSRYTLRRINVQAVSITSSAVLFLLFAAVSNYPSYSRGNISLYLTTCFRALDEFTLSWKSAQRAKDLLLGLQRQWDLRTGSNKPTQRADGVLYTPRKRSKTSSGLYRMVPVSHDLALQVNLDLDCMLRTEVEALSGSYRQDIFDMAPGTGGCLDGHSSG